MATANEALVRRFYDEFCNGRDASCLPDIIAADYTAHDPQRPPIELPETGPEQARLRFGFYQDNVDGFWDVQELRAAGDDMVVVRWLGRGHHIADTMGVAPTGNPVVVDALSLFRIADGRIAEEWTVFDALGLAQQVGAIPAHA